MSTRLNQGAGDYVQIAGAEFFKNKPLYFVSSEEGCQERTKLKNGFRNTSNGHILTSSDEETTKISQNGFQNRSIVVGYKPRKLRNKKLYNTSSQKNIENTFSLHLKGYLSQNLLKRMKSGKQQ